MDYLDSMRFIYNKISELSFKKLDEYVTEMAKLLQKPKSEKSDLYIDIQYKEQFFTKYPEVISFSPPIEGWYGVTTNELSKVYFLIKNDSIKMVATDSFRLAEKTIFFKKPLGLKENYSFILPQKAAKEIVNIFGSYINENNLLLTSVSPHKKLDVSL